MITQENAELLAVETLKEFTLKCEPKTPEDIANILMKLVSVAGVNMCAYVGYEEAVARMEGTAKFIKDKMADFKPIPTH